LWPISIVALFPSIASSPWHPPSPPSPIPFHSPSRTAQHSSNGPPLLLVAPLVVVHSGKANSGSAMGKRASPMAGGRRHFPPPSDLR
jgi:hypothetical protein